MPEDKVLLARDRIFDFARVYIDTETDCRKAPLFPDMEQRCFSDIIRDKIDSCGGRIRRMGIYQIKRRRYRDRITDMWKDMRRHIVLLGLAAVFVLVYCGFCTVQMKREDSLATRNYVRNYTEQRADMIRMEITNGQAAMLGLAESVSQVEDGSEKVLLEHKRMLYHMDFIALYERNGAGAATAGEVPEYLNAEKLQEDSAVSGSLREGECSVSIEDQNIIYTVNLYQNGEAAGVLCGGKSTAEMQEIITVKSFQQRGSSYILDGKDNILLAAESKENPQIWELIRNRTQDQKLQTDLGEMDKRLADQEGGVFDLTLPGNHRYFVSYVPTGIGNWTSVTVVPADLFTGVSNQYVTRMLAGLLVTFLIFGLLFSLLFKNYNENEKKMKKLAFLDEVTGGINGVEFALRYRQLCSRHAADQYAIALMDVVDFKMINKNFGTKYGDKMLRYFYSVIESSLRKEDREFAARTETDHFFLCLKERDPKTIQKRLDEMVKNINTFQEAGMQRYAFRFKKGVSFAEDMDTDITVIQDQARAALKNQSHENQDLCVFYDRSIAAKIQKEKDMEQLFALSVASGRFLVYLQPKVSLKTETITGAEALVRWDCPGIGFIRPDEFIPLLENNGSIRILDKYVFEKVCIWLKERKLQKKSLLPVSVNLSRNNFIYDDFLKDYAIMAEKYGIDKSLIEFEVTETFFLDEDHMEKVKAGIRQMHAFGFKCAMDDFGVGFSSLTSLRTFEIDVLKMDRSFFKNLGSRKSQDVISCIVDLAEKLDIKTVAEGIETQEQIEQIRALRCDVVQGYYFSKPLPMAEFEEWMERFEQEHVRHGA